MIRRDNPRGRQASQNIYSLYSSIALLVWFHDGGDSEYILVCPLVPLIPGINFEFLSHLPIHPAHSARYVGTMPR